MNEVNILVNRVGYTIGLCYKRPHNEDYLITWGALPIDTSGEMLNG